MTEWDDLSFPLRPAVCIDCLLPRWHQPTICPHTSSSSSSWLRLISSHPPAFSTTFTSLSCTFSLGPPSFKHDSEHAEGKMLEEWERRTEERWFPSCYNWQKGMEWKKDDTKISEMLQKLWKLNTLNSAVELLPSRVYGSTVKSQYLSYTFMLWYYSINVCFNTCVSALKWFKRPFLSNRGTTK